MSTFKSRVSFSLTRFKRFLIVLLRNRRGALGVSILILFTMIALFAPLVTPHDPVYGRFVSGDYAVPIWFKQLYGDQGICENYTPLVENFDSAMPLNSSDSGFLFEAPEGASAQYVSAQYASSIGRNNPGSLSITFQREKDAAPLGQVRVNLTTRFNYPFEVPPQRFTLKIYTLTTGTGKLLKDEITQTSYTLLDVPAQIKVFVERVGGEPYDLSLMQLNSTDVRFVGPRFDFWDNKRETRPPKWDMIPRGKAVWSPDHALDSYDTQVTYTLYNPGKPDPKAAMVNWNHMIFPNQGEYIYGLEIVFYDNQPSKDVKTVVYVDDVSGFFYGNAWGILGTDQMGRDIFSQLVYGARVSLYIGLLSSLLSVGIGLIVGLIAGYIIGIADEIIMRVTDLLLVLPSLPLLIVLIAVMGQSMNNIILLIGLLGWMGFARVVRSQVLSLRERPFIEAAKAVGAGKYHIISRHVLPNVMSLVYVTLALTVPGAILLEAALSWLGLYDPSVMSWGRMLHDVQTHPQAVEMWWWVLPPGLSIAAISLSFILLGYALDEVLNPRLRIRR